MNTNELDDIRKLVPYLKDEINRKDFESRPHDYEVRLYISEDKVLTYSTIAFAADSTEDAIQFATDSVECHGVKTYGAKSCELWYPF
jgi:hypothetical protein